MPEISLQAYENEIDQLVEQARYLESLAHVRHILGQYPHYVGAYYLLGKTMLEADLPGLAADMFRRALSADPEHLMARVGLGLAHEHSNNLDASIWNLLRALELDPGNNDIGDELRRMYGRSEGLEPDYIPQTPAGLARLYIRGNRNGRAVTQLRALLDEEPARPDLMTALAEAYWRDEQIVQASDMCQEILDKMPHNCKANLLLGTLWVNSGQEEGWTYLQRAQAVDPANTMAEGLFGSESLLEPQTVSLDRLVYDPDAIEVDQESAWFKRLEAASVTAGISEAPPEMTESEMRLVDITAGLESQIEIPDWLRELGAPDEEEDAGGLSWMADLGAEAAPEVSEDLGLVEGEVFGELDDTLPLPASLEEPELLEGEVEEASPDWQKELTVQEMSFDLDESEGAPDWLMELIGEEGEAEDTPSAVGESEAEDSSDRLADLTVEEGAGDLGALTGEAASGEDADWLAELGAVDEADAGALDWLGEPPSTVVEEGATGVVEAAADAGEPSELGDVPDWLKALEPEAAAGAGVIAPEVAELAPSPVETEPAVVAETEAAVSEEEAVPEWLAGLAPAIPETESEVAELEEEAVPDWLAELAPADTEGGSADADVVDTGTSDWLAELTESLGETEPTGESLTVLESPGLTEPAAEEDGVLTGAEALSWLDSLTADMGEDQPTAALVEPEDLAAETLVPEAAADDETLEMTIPAPEAGEAEIPPVDAAAWADEVPDEQPEMLSGDDALAWLQSLTVGKEEELRAQAEAESEARVAEILGRRAPEPPSVSVEEPAQEPAEVEAEVAEEADIVAPAVTETEAAEVEITPLIEEDEPVSGDDALAWLESLAAGTEEELQALVEPEPVVAEIPEMVLEVPEMEETAPSEGVPAEGVPAEDAPAEGVLSDVVALEAADETAVGELLEEESDLLSGDDSLAWLESLVVGQEDELRAQAEAESAARVDEILGRKPAVREPEPAPEPEPEPEVEIAVPPAAEMDIVDVIAGEAPATVIETLADEDTEAPTEQGELMSGDDALAWLQSLTAGKEDELRAQAEAESKARVDEILGRKPAVREPEPEPEREPEPELEPEVEIAAPPAAEMDIVDAIAGEAPATVIETPVDEDAEAPTEQGELMSGDDALAWLQSLTAGKEDELRAQAEAESKARVDEILGRRRTSPVVEATPVEPEPEEVETVVAEPSEGAVEAARAKQAAEALEVVVEEELGVGEDAVAWLSELSPEKASELEAQLGSEAEATVPSQEGERGYFGWSAFGGEPEEVPAPPAAPEVVAADEPVEPESPLPDLPAVEPEVAITEPVEAVAPPAEVAAPPAEVAAPIIEEPAIAEQPATAEEQVVEEVPAPAETRPEAEPSEVTADDLDEMRAYTKRKRSDHAARLSLARALWHTGEIQESMQHYGRLIKSGARSDEVTADLEHYVESGPSSASVMRTFGDAYMKFGDLDKALEIYNRAMDLL